MGERVNAIGRIIVTGVLFINAVLTASGHSPIPFDEGAINETVSNLAAAASIVWVWWKNNNVTKHAIERATGSMIHYDDEADFDDIHEVEESDVCE